MENTVEGKILKLTISYQVAEMHFFSFLAEAQISGSMRDGYCNPIVVAFVIANDNLTKLHRPLSSARPSGKETPQQKNPPLDAEKSCSMVKSALESCGIMVIPIVNRSGSYLQAIIKELRNGDIPTSCELFWFIFTGHGRGNKFYMNGESMFFSDFINSASKIKVKYMTFFFECCQVEGKEIEVVDIKKQHMCLYSSPPNEVSIHFKGVGLLMTCMVEMLEAGYKGTLNSLQEDLRSNYMQKTTEILGVPLEDQETFMENRLPVFTSNMFDKFILHTKIAIASEF